jgi:hypothetical protein
LATAYDRYATRIGAAALERDAPPAAAVSAQTARAAAVTPMSLRPKTAEMLFT